MLTAPPTTSRAAESAISEIHAAILRVRASPSERISSHLSVNQSWYRLTTSKLHFHDVIQVFHRE